MMSNASSDTKHNRLVEVLLDEASIGRARADIEQERSIAIFDILEENDFQPEGHIGGPYTLTLSHLNGRIVLEIKEEDGTEIMTHILSVTPFRATIKDYFMICESYYAAIRSAPPNKIEAIDMARRGIHNEGAERLQDRLAGKIKIDFNTARRLFTLICVLQQKP